MFNGISDSVIEEVALSPEFLPEEACGVSLGP
jgi:hypothetical protein